MPLTAHLIHCLQLSDRLGINRKEAADIVGVSPSLFDRFVREGKMPEPVRISNRKIWNRMEVEKAFEALFPHAATELRDQNSWDHLLQ